MSNKKPRNEKQLKSGSEESDDRRLSRGRTRPDAIFPVAPSALALPASYAATLQQIKDFLRTARVRAVLAANPVVIEAYWQIGKIILARQHEAGWGAKIIDRLAADLKEAFPDMGGAITSKSVFYEKLCSLLSGRANCATTCCTITVGTCCCRHPTH